MYSYQEPKIPDLLAHPPEEQPNLVLIIIAHIVMLIGAIVLTLVG